VTKRILLFNTGDVGVKFQWDHRKLEPDFSISPAEGFVQAHNDVAMEVTFSPAVAGRSAVIERVQCRVREDPKCTLEMNVNGQCVDRPPVTEALKFQTNVRKTQVKQIKITNTTGSPWKLKPQLDNESWVISPSFMEVKPQDSVTFDVSYQPTVTTKNLPDGQPEQGMIFIPLPTGEARLYHLEGIADPPKPSGEITRDVQCKTLHTEKIVVTNWLKKPQKFKVARAFTTDAGIVIKGLDDIDIPPQASRDYKFTFMSYKDAKVTGTVTFTNEDTGEYLFYNCTFKTLPAATVDTITLRTPVRQKAVHDITVENPLVDKQVTLVSKCDNADIAVAPSFTVPPCGEGKLTVTYFPLVMRPQEVVARLTLSCPELGDFPYVLKLCTTHAGADKFIRFQCPLGSSQTQTLRLTHFAKANADFVCKFVDPKPTTFVKTNGQYAIKCPPAGPDGAEVSFDVTFEPSKIGDVKETLSVASPVAGEYTFSLAGSCLPPERQGPVDIKSGSNAQIPFKNVFAENVTFSIHCDHAAFAVNKASEVIQAKKAVNFTVTFKAVDDVFPVRGKLIVSCASPGDQDKKVEWVYYLRGLKNEGKEK
jgi:hydrocephalus-inducing protein